jgi:hypothetical protein
MAPAFSSQEKSYLIMANENGCLFQLGSILRSGVCVHEQLLLLEPFDQEQRYSSS